MIRRLMAFLHKWVRHEEDCAVHRGGDCSCGLWQELRELEDVVGEQGDGKRLTRGG